MPSRPTPSCMMDILDRGENAANFVTARTAVKQNQMKENRKLGQSRSVAKKRLLSRSLPDRSVSCAQQRCWISLARC
jgi:hypothetical protein